MVSGTKELATDPLSSVHCEVGPPWIIVVPACPMGSSLDLELGNL